MCNYIQIALDPNYDSDSLIRAFYLHPMTRSEKRNYSEQELSIAGTAIINLLLETSTEHIIDIVDLYQNEIQEITTGSIPQFSELTDADYVPNIILANPNCKYKLIGYFFNKDAPDYSNQKYGENHYKLAAQLGLCEHADRHAPDGITAVSFLGMKYKDLPIEQRDIIRPKLCLQVPFIQRILVLAKHEQVYAFKELQSLLTVSTSIRRRSSIQQMMHAIEASMKEGTELFQRIDWGYVYK